MASRNISLFCGEIERLSATVAFNIRIGALRGNWMVGFRVPMKTADEEHFLSASTVSPVTSVISLNPSNRPVGREEDYVGEGLTASLLYFP